MYVLGLTGSIGMGKSSAAAMFRRLGVPVHDADATVHRLIGRGGQAVGAIGAAFPGVVSDGVVDRQKLGAVVFQDSAALACLESILHPLVRRSAWAFLARQSRQRQPIAVLDIPLLYETGGQSLCDGVVVVSAPKRVQESRVLGRGGMTREKFTGILAAQMSDGEKRRRADFVVSTGRSKRDTLAQIARIVAQVRGRAGHRWPPRAEPLGHRR